MFGGVGFRKINTFESMKIFVDFFLSPLSVKVENENTFFWGAMLNFYVF